MSIKKIDGSCYGNIISSGNIGKGCVWRFKIPENIGYSNNRESTSKSKGIIFVKGFFAVDTLIPSCMIDDIAAGDGQDRMSNLLIFVILYPVCHVAANRTLAIGLIKGDVYINAIFFMSDSDFLDIVSFKIEELKQIVIGNERIDGIIFIDFIVNNRIITEFHMYNSSFLYYEERITRK